MKIGKLDLNIKNYPILISEISGNHNGKLSLAVELVRKAAKNGSDLIKLQTYEADNLTLNLSRPEFFIKNKIEKTFDNQKVLMHLWQELNESIVNGTRSRIVPTNTAREIILSAYIKDK